MIRKPPAPLLLVRPADVAAVWNPTNANYYTGNTTAVGQFHNSASAYGTFDQSGNVREWDEAAIAPFFHGTRGGSFYSWPYTLQAMIRDYEQSSYEDSFIGFRLAYVPEPTTLSLLALAGAGLLARRKRKGTRGG